MIPLNYHHLYYFWMTAKLGSIAKARERLLLAQPTLSLQIQQLERSLGKKLLNRGRGGVSLTAEGRTAFEFCERIFSQGEALARLLRQGEAGPPLLRLGVAKSLSREIVLRTLDVLERRGPDLPTTIFSGSAAELQERLRLNTLDLALSDVDFAFSLGRDFRAQRVGEIPVHFLAAPKIARFLRGFPARCREVPMLFRSPEHPVRKEAEHYLRSRRLSWSLAAQTEDTDLIRTLAIRGKGVALLNGIAVEQDLTEGRLLRLQRGATGIRENVWLLTPAAAPWDPRLRKALQALSRDLPGALKPRPRAQ